MAKKPSNVLPEVVVAQAVEQPPPITYTAKEIETIFYTCKHNPKPITHLTPSGYEYVIRITDRDDIVVHECKDKILDQAWQNAASWVVANLGGSPKILTEAERAKVESNVVKTSVGALQSEVAELKARLEALSIASQPAQTNG